MIYFPLIDFLTVIRLSTVNDRPPPYISLCHLQDSARRRQHAAAARLNRSLFAEGARHRSEEQEREKAATRSATLQEVSGSADGPKSLLDSVMKLVKFGEQEQEKAATHSGTLQEVRCSAIRHHLRLPVFVLCMVIRSRTGRSQPYAQPQSKN